MKNTRQKIYNTNIFTDKADSMQTRMQSLGSNFLSTNSYNSLLYIFHFYKVNPVCTKDWTTKHYFENFVLW